MKTDQFPQEAIVRNLLDQVLVRALEGLGAHTGTIFLRDPAGEILDMEVSVGLPPEFVGPLRRLRLAGTASDPVVEAVRERHLVWVRSGEDLARRYPAPAMLMPYDRAQVFVPIMAGETVWGAMVMSFPHGRSPELGTDERRSVWSSARCAGWLLRGAAEAGSRLTPSPVPRFLPGVESAAVDPTGSHPAADFLRRLPEGACCVDANGRITFIDRTSAGLLGLGAQSIPGLRGSVLCEAVPWLRRAGYEDRHRAAVFSMLPTSFTAVRPGGGRLLFQLYPDPTGVSVRIRETGDRGDAPAPRDMKEETSASRLRVVHHLLHLAGSLTQAATAGEVADLAAEHFLLAFQAQTVALLVPEAGRVRIIGHRGVGAELLSRFDRKPLTAQLPSVFGLTTGAPAFFASRQELCASGGATADDGMSAWAYLPLIASGYPVGTCVLGYDRPHRFPSEERALLTSVSALIAQALERARQYDAQQQVAHGLQAGLLPRHLPVVPGLQVAARYLPASHGMDIGGDFYDLIRLSATEAAAVIGDVQGHSVRAAGLMGQVRTAVHAYAVAGAAPGEVLARTNRLLVDLEADLLVSCLYAHLDLTRRTAHLATAGHWPPFLRRPDLRTELLDLPPGPLLGVDPAAEYPSVQVALPDGTVLAFYTDGLIEIPGTDHAVGTTALCAVLSHAGRLPHDIADALLARAQPTGNRTDDTALLVLRAEATA
ncbi:SpoIIE family protein phosphatase [Streptomyces sp. NPDC049099]|uniref:SpoIIE family protein phosphatase n=1 Tax=Streptomyces sp. NPDC049099 TaxID=3155768 RepID=UPI003415D798